MNAKRVFFGMVAALALLLIGLVAGVYGISSLLKDKGNQLVADKAQINQLTSKQSGIARSKQEINKYASLAAVTKSIVPQDKDQAEAVREITNIAQQSNVTLNNISFATSTIGTVVAPVAGAAVTPTPAASKSNLSQLTPVLNIPGVYDLQITINNNDNNTVTFNQLDSFLRGLENNRRTAEVSSLLITPQPNSPDELVFSLVINDYIKPS